MKLKIISVLFVVCCAVGNIGCQRSAHSYVDKGNKLQDQGKYEDALLNYRKAVQIDPKSGEAYYRLGLLARKQNQLQDAFGAFIRAAELLPDRNDIKVSLADLCLQIYLPASSNRPQVIYKQLVKVSDQLLAKDPNSFDGLRVKGMLAVTDRKVNEGIELFRRANAIIPMKPEVVVPLAESLFVNNQLAESEKLVLELIEKQKTVGPAYDLLYRLYISTKRFQDADHIIRVKVDNNPKEAAYVVQLASHYLRQRKTPEMEATLQRLLNNRQDFPQARLQVGDFYAGIGNPQEAARQFEAGATENPKEKLTYQKRLIAAWVAQNKKEEAAKAVDDILREQPDDIDSRGLRALLLLDRGKPALTEFLDLVKRRPNNADYRVDLGRAYMAQGQFENARAQFLEAIARNRNSYAARTYLLEVSLRTDQHKEALMYANQVLAAQPANPRVRLLRVLSLMGIGTYREARSELTRLIKEYPQYVDAHLQLGALNILEKRYKEADDIFRKFYQPAKGDIRPLEGLVESQLAQKQLDHAVQLMSQELKKSPNSSGLRAAFATTAARAGKYDLALEQYQQLASGDPKNVEYQIRLGETYQLKGDLGAAIVSFRKATEIAPKSMDVNNNLAYLLDLAGRKAEAIAAYRHSLTLQPDDSLTLNNLAFALAEQGNNMEEALKLALLAQRNQPDNPGVIDTVGWVYLKNGMRQSALQIFNNLVKQHPEVATYHYHLGLALIESGDKKKGKEALENALTRQPSKTEELKIKELITRIG